jgi:hypothetical protein
MLSSYIFACAWSLLEGQNCIIVGITYIAREACSYLDYLDWFDYTFSRLLRSFVAVDPKWV